MTDQGDTGLQRTTAKIPPEIDPERHGAAIAAQVEKKTGLSGWKIESFDPETRVVTLTRGSALTQIRASGDKKDKKILSVRAGIRATEVDALAAQLANANPGFYLTKLDLHLLRAELTKLNKEELNARDAIAVVLGVKPWDVVVRQNASGGFDLTLPRNYQSSKHDDKLQEAASTRIGKEGWYITVDANTLTGKIVPSDPPTFPPLVSYPVDRKPPKFKLSSEEWAKIPLGMKLPGLGKTEGDLFYLDLLSGAHLQIGGVSGGGKLVQLSTKVPTPTGWTTIADLARGDTVYSMDGTFSEVVGFSEIQSWDTYRVHFDDGQFVDVGPSHQWLASTFISRNAYSNRRVAARDRKYAEDMAMAARIRKAMTKVETGQCASLSVISQMAGFGHTTSGSVIKLVPESMAQEGFVSLGRPATEYNVIELNDRLPFTLSGKQLTTAIVGMREWATVREIADRIAQELHGRDATRPERALVKKGMVARGISTRAGGSASMKCSVYPIDEVLEFMARYYEENAGLADSRKPVQPLETVVDTQYMFETLRASGERNNWAVRVAGAIEGEETDLSIDPWLLGVWLGDGTSLDGTITVGKDDHDWMTSQFGEHSKRRIDRLTRAGDETHLWLVRVEKLRTKLREVGLLGSKHIPVSYLRASAAQRLALLQGIVDTDGYVALDGQTEICLSDERLALDTLELVRSLGIKAFHSINTSSYRDEDGVHHPCKDRHRIKFTTDTQVARMPRKVECLPKPGSLRETSKWHYVVDIEVLPPQKMRCVKIDHPSHEFLVGNFIPTHNSVFINDWITGVLAIGAQLVVVDLPSKAVDFLWCKKFCRPGGWGCDDMPSAVTALALVMEEGDRRAKILAEHEVVKWTDLPDSYSDEFTPIAVIVDELTGLFFPEEEPKQLPKDHPLRIEAQNINLQKAMLKKYIKRIAAELRFVGVSLLLSSQVASVNTGIDPALRTNLHHKVLMGAKPTEGQRRLVFSDAGRVPVVPGNVAGDSKAGRGSGSAEPEGQEPFVFKSYFATVATLEKYLIDLGVKTTLSPEPTPAQIAKHTPTLGDDSVVQTPKPKGPRQYEDWELDENGKPLQGYERANAARHAAANPGKPTPKQRAESKEEAEWAKQSGDVVTRKAERCESCGGFINPNTGQCGCST